MPLGASFLVRWCRSTMAISHVGPARPRPAPTSFMSRLTARLMLGEIKSGIRARNGFQPLPLLPHRSRSFRLRTQSRGLDRLRRFPALPRAGKKSMITFTGADGASTRLSLTPSGDTPAIAPASSPICGMSLALQGHGQLERSGPHRSTGSTVYPSGLKRRAHQWPNSPMPRSHRPLLGSDGPRCLRATPP